LDAHLAALTAQRKAAVLGWEAAWCRPMSGGGAAGWFVEAALENIGPTQRAGDGGSSTTWPNCWTRFPTAWRSAR
jgi:hypothetical protein